ncbi:MAG: CPBP family intramembrane metalloprotease, partial [Ruminococcus sp.]|nr:CPBP family intramembrane metalloprotease [Ruminococcus sp.]
MTKSIIFNLSPFNNRADISKAEYIIKKLLGFAVIYMAAAVLGEGIILGGLYAAGYDALHGDMPGGEVAMLLSLYGFAVFAAITLIYRRLVEKKRPEHIGIKKAGKKYFIGIVIAALLLIAIVLFSCLVGAASFERQTQK